MVQILDFPDQTPEKLRRKRSEFFDLILQGYDIERDEDSLPNPGTFIAKLLLLQDITRDLIRALGDYAISQGWLSREDLIGSVDEKEALELLVQKGISRFKAKKILRGEEVLCPKCGGVFACSRCGFTYC